MPAPESAALQIASWQLQTWVCRRGRSRMVIRTAYGPGLATAEPVSDEQCTADLGETAVRYLLAARPG